MRLHFLGGADEVGASAVLVEAAGRRILVDAGVRMGGARGDPLPDLAPVSALGGLDAVLLTHAHLDHAGALPLVHGAFPRAPVLMTEPTRALLRVLLLDALKIMEGRAERADEIPLYPQAAVEALLARAEGALPLAPREIPFASPGASVRVTFFPAGHVLGAAAVGIETPEGSALVTGDVSFTDQLTVPGMARPRFAPDVVVCESTYGDRLHASRRAEEERLAAAVIETLRAGGKVLVPAFALGRAQEVLLVLRRALAAHDAPAAAVRYDGMVRAICGVYAQHAGWLTPTLRERAQAGRGLFETGDGRVLAVREPAERAALLAGPPVVLVSSSGMLTGGPSVAYAEGLLGGAEHLVALTGYQDEEAPGRQLQALAAGSAGDLVLGGRRLPVRCRVATFGLSAHSDAGELVGFLGSLRPQAVALVHGDGGAREALARRLLGEAGLAEVHLPALGDVVEVEPAASRGAPARALAALAGARGSREAPTGGAGAGLGGGRLLEAAGLAALHAHLFARARPGQTFTAAELGVLWHGEAATPAEVSAIHGLLDEAQPWFLADRKRPYLFRLVDPAAAAAPPTATEGTGAGRDAAGRLEQNAALALAGALIGPERGLYRRGAERERWTLRLYLRFPLVQVPACAEPVRKLVEESGWQVEVHPETHVASLTEEVLALLATEADLRPIRAPSVRLDARQVTVQVATLPTAAAVARLDAALRERTGFSLGLEAARVSGCVSDRERRDAAGRLELNQAMAAIEAAFPAVGPRPSRRSKRDGPEGPFIELGFVSPEVGARFAGLLAELSERTGWALRVAERVDQQAVLGLVRARLPTSWVVRKGPGLDLASREVRLGLAAPPPEEERRAFEVMLLEETGFSLALR